jgi:hypothetical protein
LIAQFDNKLLSSFLLLIDHKIQQKGQAFFNHSSQFYPISSNIQGQYVYSLPFKQICNDTSISGANIISGVYLNGNPITIGQSGLVSLNHYDGACYFSSPLPKNTVISGDYAIKDFSINLTDKQEYKLLFETVYKTNNMYVQTLSGLSLDTRTFPIVYLKTKNDENKPFALGGIENKTKVIRAIVIADTEYQRTAVTNILKDMCYSPFYLYSGIPFDSMGNFTGKNYSFDDLQKDPSYFPWIMKVTSADVPSVGSYAPINQNVCLVDFTINTLALHSY